jgi:hypothetical protein
MHLILNVATLKYALNAVGALLVQAGLYTLKMLLPFIQARERKYS